MTDLGPLRPGSGFPGHTAGEAFGAPAGGVRAIIRDDLQLASVIARKGAGAAVAERLRDRFGAAPGAGPVRTGDAALAWLGVGPDRWLAVKTGRDGRWAAVLARELEGLAAVADQSDGYAVIEVAGPAARETLAKGFPIDLHPAAFGPEAAAVTLVAHIGAVIWRGEGEDRFLIAVFRSTAESFWHWLSGVAAAHGLALG